MIPIYWKKLTFFSRNSAEALASKSEPATVMKMQNNFTAFAGADFIYYFWQLNFGEKCH